MGDTALADASADAAARERAQKALDDEKARAAAEIA
eukprot:SAG11_NODE_25420_length_359_cov_0.442308_2_plen_35_part_01